jgi:arylsulfatase A-like enzyme
VEALRVPLIFRFPGKVEQKKRLPHRVSLLDIAPTMLEQAGIPIPEGIQGRDLSPLLRGEDTLVERDLFFETLTPQIRKKALPQYGLLDENWKAIFYGNKKAELFEFPGDPLEENSLHKDSGKKAILEACRKKVEEWKKRVKNLKKLENQLPMSKEDRIRLYKLGYIDNPELDGGKSKKESGKK